MSDGTEALLSEARRAQKAVFLAAEADVAADLSRIIRGLADALEACSRRSGVPEPSAECPKCGVRATGQTPSTFYTHHDETCGGPLEEQQGEPSDDYEAGYAEGFHHGVSSPRGSAEDDREQGEPSDAQVRAAQDAMSRWVLVPESQVRAALRAAEGAR